MNDTLPVRASVVVSGWPWAVKGSIQRFVWWWAVGLLVLMEGVGWLWPALSRGGSSEVWGLLKIVVVAGGLWCVLRQAFQPVQTLGESLDSMPAQALTQIAEPQPEELTQLATAVRRLLQTQQSAVDEQR